VGIVPSGNSSDELELLARFRELSPERQADVLKIEDIWYEARIDGDHYIRGDHATIKSYARLRQGPIENFIDDDLDLFD
jgi:hypothetical protein